MCGACHDVTLPASLVGEEIPLEAFTAGVDPITREIDLQWGTRLGKTTIAMQLMAKSAATKPMPGTHMVYSQGDWIANSAANNPIGWMAQADMMGRFGAHGITPMRGGLSG